MSTELIPHDGADLMQMVQLTAMNVNGISEQMGIMLNRVNENSQRIVALEDRLTVHEQTVTLTRAQARQMNRAVHDRAFEVLGIEHEGGVVSDDCIDDYALYYGRFCGRLYADAKKHSKMGTTYAETLKVDYGEVMDYINAWFPECEGGVEGYKEYLDKLRSARE